MELSSESSEWLNYHHLRYFWAVAREGGLVRAARRLRVSAPSISAQIAALESALREKLFHRAGRGLELTDFGRVVLGYAEEIFTLGRELLLTRAAGPVARPVRLAAGVVDSLPKRAAFDLLRPALRDAPGLMLSCHEGSLAELLGRLAAHRLDVVLADEPAPPGTPGRISNHALGEGGTVFLATAALARSMRGKFPRRLHHAPALLPAPRAVFRRDLDDWFRGGGVEPRIAGEFDDAALAMEAAAEGLGFVAVPEAVAKESAARFGLTRVGKSDACRTRFFAITAERRHDHPAIQAIIAPRGRAAR